MNGHPEMTEEQFLIHMLSKLEEVQIVFEAHEQEMIQGDPITACTKEMFTYIYTLLYYKWINYET